MLRSYRISDQPELINLLQLNTPEYFDESEEKDYLHYLNEEVEDYFVVEENNQIIGGGGINYFLEEGVARISWDLIHPESQGKGIGSQLTRHRIQHIRQQAEIHTIIVRTSQLAYSFYQKMGFELEKIEKDFWAKDFDLYLMKMHIPR